MGQQDLTTVDNFKSWYNFQGNAADERLIAQLIARRSDDIRAYLDRPTLLKHTFTEYRNGTGGSAIMLRQWPVIAVNTLTVDGVTISPGTPPASGYTVDVDDGFPPGRQSVLRLNGACYGGAFGSGFNKGNNNVVINYDAGYFVKDEAQTVPSATPYKVTAAQNFGSWVKDEGVKDTNGTVYTYTTSATPSSGQYTVNNGVYVFNSAQAGVSMLISYDYVPNTIESACLEAVAERYSYRQHIGQKSHSAGGQVTTSYDNKGLTDFVREMIQPYKRMVPM